MVIFIIIVAVMFLSATTQKLAAFSSTTYSFNGLINNLTTNELDYVFEMGRMYTLNNTCASKDEVDSYMSDIIRMISLCKQNSILISSCN